MTSAIGCTEFSLETGFGLKLADGRQLVRWLCRSVLGRWSTQHQNGLGVPRQKQRVALAPRQELYLATGLAHVRFKAEGQFAVGFQQMLLSCLRNVGRPVPGCFRQWRSEERRVGKEC